MEKSISIPKLQLKQIAIPVKGTTPYISHAFSQKAKRKMLESQQGKAKQGKHERRNPYDECIRSLYWIEGEPNGQEIDESNYQKLLENGKFGIPSVAFKNAMVRAATDVGQKMTDMRRLLHVLNELTEIKGTPTIREDTVVVGRGSGDLRYRAEFIEWNSLIEIEFNASLIDESNILNLINTAGYGVGVGDWRPEKNGQFGRFAIDGSAVVL